MERSMDSSWVLYRRLWQYVRPYRGAQRLDEISRTLGEFADKGILDPDIVALARDDLDSSFSAATQTI